MATTSSSSTGAEWANWLDSMEGVPEWPGPVAKVAPTGWEQSVAFAFTRLGELAPGILLAAGLALAGERLAHWLGSSVLGLTPSPIGAVPVAVLLGLVVRNLIGLPAIYEAGLRLCVRTLLRAGIVLLGLRLSLGAAGEVGLVALPVVVLCIATALILVTHIGRAVGLPRRLGALIAVGTSICGVSAIVATAPAIDAEDDEVSYAVACVALFGLIALFGYPFLAHAVFASDPTAAGIFLGTAIHDTAQVAGAGLIYQQQFDAPDALSAATVTKLVRNAGMAAVIPLIAVLYRRADGKRSRLAWHQAVPGFVIAFVIAVGLRTISDFGDQAFGVIDRSIWKEWLTTADRVSGWCLALAMVSVGLGTGLGKLRTLGMKPFVVGLIAALIVGGVAMLLLLLGRPFIR